MSTKKEPLLSARLFDVLRSLDGNVAEWVTDDLLGIHDDLAKHEAARAKDAELIQRLVDGLKHAQKFAEEYGYGPLETVQLDLDAAAVEGFKPTEP